MRLVLLGPHFSAKSSTGNTILGRKAFDRIIEENLKENGEVAGRNLTVAYTPGFEKDYLIGKRLEDIKLSILRTVTDWSSGTHAFIVVQCVESSFADEEKSALEKIMETLGERVWNHTLVVFAVGDELGDTPIELFIASEGDALQWLIEKCGNRYHVLNTKNWGDGSQVTELLEKIEEMVAGNRNSLYEIDRVTLERIERTVAVPIKRAESMDDPLNRKLFIIYLHIVQYLKGLSDILIAFLAVAERCRSSSGISSSSFSQRSQEAPEERHFKSSSKRSSGVESLGSIPEFD